MRFLLAIICIAILSFAAEYIFNAWWIIAVIAFLASLYIKLSPGKAFWMGFLAIFLMWMVVALMADIGNTHILSSKMSKLFHLSGSFLFILIASIIGGLVGGMASWSGAMLMKKRK